MAEYSKLTEDDLKKLKFLFQFPHAKIQPVDGGMANTSFKIGSNDILTILDNHDQESAIHLVDVIQHVAKHGIQTPKIKPMNDGNLIAHVNKKIFILKEYATGIRMDKHNPVPVSHIGELNSKIHQIPILPSMSVRQRRIPKDWQAWLNGEIPNDLNSAIKRAVKLERTGLFDQHKLCFTHGDLFLDNMLWNDHHIIALDWETATIDSPLLDLGITLAALRDAKSKPFDHFIAELISGYKKASKTIQITPDDLVASARYAATMLGFHRYYRQNILHPNPNNFHIYKDLIAFWDD